MHCTNCSEKISEQSEICPKCGVRPFNTKNYCHGCGNSVNENQEMCVKCGVQLKNNTRSVNGNSSQSPVLMGVLSFFIIGLGQLIMGQTAKGIAMFVVALLVTIVTFGFGSIILLAVSVIDAVQIAKKKQDGKVVGDWEFF